MGLFGDTWASNASKNSANTLGSESGSLFGEGQAIQANLLPFLRGEMTASHAFTPTQLNEMLTAAGAGSGGAASSLAGEGELAAARTGNSAGAGALMDKIARAKTQGLAKANEGIAASDVDQTLKLHQAGASGLEGLYGADTGDAMKAAGLQQEAIKNQMEASTTGGWMRNILGAGMDLSQMFKNYGQGREALANT